MLPQTNIVYIMIDKKLLKEKIEQLSKSDLEKIVLKFTAKYSELGNYLLVNYFDKESGENDLFEKTKADLDMLFTKSYRGFSEELQLANMISACIKRINEFVKVCKNKNLETNLLMYVLEFIFSLYTNLLGTCFTAYDYKVGLMVKRTVTLIQTKLHSDYQIEYIEKINQYLSVLHRTSNHINTIYLLPKSI